MSDASNTKSSNPPTQNIQWGGRFTEATDAFVQVFTASVDFDQKMAEQDINGSIAHATMLAKVGVLTEAERDTIIEGLNTIRSEIEAGRFDWRVDLEDELLVALHNVDWAHHGEGRGLGDNSHGVCGWLVG